MKVGIIGCGAAGLAAASFCGGDVTVLERNEKAAMERYQHLLKLKDVYAG